MSRDLDFIINTWYNISAGLHDKNGNNPEKQEIEIANVFNHPLYEKDECPDSEVFFPDGLGNNLF